MLYANHSSIDSWCGLRSDTLVMIRLGILLSYALVSSYQFEWTILPTKLSSFDFGYRALMYSSILEDRIKNPMLFATCDILLSSARERSALSDEAKEASLRKVRVSNRLWLAYLLHKQPTLRMYRKHQTSDLIENSLPHHDNHHGSLN